MGAGISTGTADCESQLFLIGNYVFFYNVNDGVRNSQSAVSFVQDLLVLIIPHQ